MSDAPRPRTGFIVVCPDWDPESTPTDHVNLLTLAQAKALRKHSETLKSPRTRILELTTTYWIVEDGDRG